MNREEIIKLAREAAKEFGSWDDWDSDKPASGPNGNDPHEEREYWILLVEFIAAAEREACAKVCDDQSKEFGGVAKGPFVTDFGKHTQMSMAAGAENCAAAIRARGSST